MNLARPASFNIKSAEVGKLWRSKTQIMSLGRPVGSVEVLTKSLAFILNRKEERGNSVVWACNTSGFVFLILLEKEHPETPGREQGEPEGQNEGGYERSRMGYRRKCIPAGPGGLGSWGPFHKPRGAVCTAPAVCPKNIS